MVPDVARRYVSNLEILKLGTRRVKSVDSICYQGYTYLKVHLAIDF